MSHTNTFVGGGVYNQAINESASVVGGESNVASGGESVVCGGAGNQAIGDGSFVGAGFFDIEVADDDDYPNNIANGVKSAIVGGELNVTGSSADHSFVGEGLSNETDASFDVISGGQLNKIIVTGADHSSIVGGKSNNISSTTATIAGGNTNDIDVSADSSFIGGGFNNKIDGTSDVIANTSGIVCGDQNEIKSEEGAIVGGTRNLIDQHSSFSIVGGGSLNKINIRNNSAILGGASNNISSTTATISGGNTNDIDVSADSSFIGGGFNNKIDGSSDIIANTSAIVGGDHNEIKSEEGAIVGGTLNLVDQNAPFSIIGGGSKNQINLGNNSAIFGGASNNIFTNLSSIVGGSSNKIDAHSDSSFIGGGFLNIIDATITHPAKTSAIVGGDNNLIKSEEGVIVGGTHNFIDQISPFSFIGGGSSNQILSSTGLDQDYSAILGGISNTIKGAAWSCIGGGLLNTIGDGISEGDECGIGGGEQNTIQGAGLVASYIAGGVENRIEGFIGFIGGGEGNHITPTSTSGASYLGVIGGGFANQLNGDYSVIGGGSNNVINSDYSSIPGGLALTSSSYGQTILGVYNKVRGNSTQSNFLTTNANDPILIIGNGDVLSVTRSTAFEISNNGHSIVYDVNGTGGASAGTPRGAIRGATYQDNIIYASGVVPLGAGAFPRPIIITSDFGTASVIETAPGEFTITLNTTKPDGTPLSLSTGAVSATLKGATADICGARISAEPVSSGTFNVHKSRMFATYNPGTPPTVTLGCTPQSEQFMFIVTGRP